MNLQTSPTNPPVRLLVVNSLSSASKLAITEILLGSVLGKDQLIDLILLVYSNETSDAEEFKLELRRCAFSCCNSIRVTSDLPSLLDADIFIFGTYFPNANKIDYDNLDSAEHFDTMYHVLKVANHLAQPLPPKEEVDENEINKTKKKRVPEKKSYKPIIIANGLNTLHILRTICKDLPTDIFFCPSPVPVAVRSALGEYLKVEVPTINFIHTWAADDEVFHVEIEKPLLKNEKVKDKGGCDKELLGADILESFNFDYLQLNEAWVKTELVHKLQAELKKNPYGPIFRAAEIVRAIQMIWQSRRQEGKVYINLGVISDGSLGTIKVITTDPDFLRCEAFALNAVQFEIGTGLPYVLPLIFEGNDWKVNKLFERDPFLQIEIKRINKRVKKHNELLAPYSKKFLEDNVIKKLFIPTVLEESSTIASTDSSEFL